MTGPSMVVDAKGAAVDVDGAMTVLSYVLVTLSALSGLLFGYDTGVVSGAMLLIRHVWTLSDFWHELIVSATIGAAWVFSLCGGYLTDLLGRKRTIFAASLVFTAGSLVMGAANGKEMLLVGRIIVGVGVGLASMSTPVYIAECAMPRNRGTLVTLYVMGATSGQFLAGIVSGLFASVHDGWRWMLGLAALPAAVLALGILFMPESPRWLVTQGRLDEAEHVLQRLRGPEASVHQELKSIRETCEEEDRIKKECGTENVLLRILRTKHARRALILGCALQAYQQLGGINTAMYYSATIIKMAGVGDNSTAIWLSAGTAGVNCLFTIVGLMIMDKVGRRPLALVSLFGAAVSLAILGSGFLLMDKTAPQITDIAHDDACATLLSCSDCTSVHNVCGFCLTANGSASCWPRDAESDLALGGDCYVSTSAASASAGAFEWAVGYCPSAYSWVAVAGLAIYLLCFAPGMGPTPWVVNSEIHALWARDVSTSLATSSNWSLNLLVSLTFLSLIDAITAAGAFFLFSAITFTGVVVLYFIMPETKGYTLEEIEDLFGAKGEPRRDTSSKRKVQSAKTDGP